jgi:hypothetical protein
MSDIHTYLKANIPGKWDVEFFIAGTLKITRFPVIPQNLASALL